MTNLFLDKMDGGKKKKHKHRDKHRDNNHKDNKHGDNNHKDNKRKNNKHGDNKRKDNNRNKDKNPYMSETELMKYINFLGEYQDTEVDISNIVDRIRHNIFKKVRTYRNKPSNDSYNRISRYLKDFLKKSNNVLHQLKKTYSEIKESNSNLRINDNIKWGFDNIIELDNIIKVGTESNGYNMSLLLAQAIINKSLQEIPSNSNITYNYNRNYNDINTSTNSSISRNGSSDSNFSIYKSNPHTPIDTSTIKNSEEIKNMFNDQPSQIFKQEILYWEYLICIALFLIGKDKKILEIFKSPDKYTKELLYKNPFIEDLSVFKKKESQGKGKGKGKSKHGGGKGKKKKSKDQSDKTKTPTEIKSETFQKLIKKYFKVELTDLSASINNSHIQISSLLKNCYRTLYPFNNRSFDIDVKIETTSSSGSIKLTPHSLGIFTDIREKYFTNYSIKGFEFLKDSDIYTFQRKNDIQKHTLKFLLGYYAVIHTTCQKAIDILGVENNNNNVNKEKTNKEKMNKEKMNKEKMNNDRKNNKPSNNYKKTEIVNKSKELFIKLKDEYLEINRGTMNNSDKIRKKKRLKEKLRLVAAKIQTLQNLS